MAEKVVLYYFDGRGKMESIRWLLAVAGVEVSRYLGTRDESLLGSFLQGLLSAEPAFCRTCLELSAESARPN